jgi:CDP-paratose 2-epimerase
MKARITGSGGLIGSECARHLCAAGWEVAGVDNDMRREFFGAAGTTAPVVSFLKALRGYTRHSIDIRDRQTIRDFFASVRPDFIIHTAAQPSHDRAAAIPYDDFDVNAVCLQLVSFYDDGIDGVDESMSIDPCLTRFSAPRRSRLT